MKNVNPSKFVLIDIKVIPNASEDKIIGWEEERLRVKIRGVPEKGKVNKRLIEFLADQLDMAKSNLSIQSGETSRLKRIRIEGMTLEDVKKII